MFCFRPNGCSINLIIVVSKSPSTKMPWLERLAYDECNQAKLRRFKNKLSWIDTKKNSYDFLLS